MYCGSTWIRKLTMKQCDICKTNNPLCKQEFDKWLAMMRPWESVHIDFAGPFYNSMWLICVDAYSQFPFVCQLTNSATSDTIAALSSIFAIEELPETIVSNNGPQLTVKKFAIFCKSHGIKHVTTALFHLASNGLAERFVRTFKTGMLKNIDGGLTIKNALVKYLSTYRFTPNTWGKIPAELLHGRKVRTLLSQVRQFHQPYDSKNNSNAQFQPNQSVFFRSYSRGEKWLKGTISRPLGKLLYIVKTDAGYVKRHSNQLRAYNGTNQSNEAIETDAIPILFAPKATNDQPPSIMQHQPQKLCEQQQQEQQDFRNTYRKRN
ncbi:uncharacterized protein K02A2.6-like [Teleopsis dalmanni]|uniref:uncharacterized protein K02A2.6-like n=1 Tax=Teleopsis dalmanni TaxID=139649 RepID=UPI0018CE8AAF|nr:uncharacterized protein K02A2.6-like [Teleopsis dalmanni]